MCTLITILVLAVASFSIMAITQVANADQKGELCVFFACGNATITGGTTSSSGGGDQPTPNTATLIVTKECVTGSTCSPNKHTITVTGNSPSPSTFQGNPKGTTVTLGPGKYTVSEQLSTFSATFTGNCVQTKDFEAIGNIDAGQTETCTIINLGNPP